MWFRRPFALIAVVIAMLSTPAAGGVKGTIAIAFGDNPDVDKAALELAAARAKDRGVDVDIVYLQSEDIAAQAVLSGQADVGVGTPYALINKHNLPIRMFFQLSRLRFFPIVNTRYYKTWEDLDGADIYVHGSGSGTEAIMTVMARNKGISYGSINYLPGSSVRAQALIKNRIKATIVDGQRMKLLTEQGDGLFAILPTPEIKASDEALYANEAFLRTNAEAIGILLDELLLVWRRVNKDPEYVIIGMRDHGLLADVPESQVDEFLQYYEDSVSVGLFSNNGGDGEVGSDLEVYGWTEEAKDGAADWKVEKFWYFEALQSALDRLGRQ